MSPDAPLDMVRRTEGLDLKVPAQAAATIIVFLLSYFGVDLDVEVAGAISVLLGFVAGYFAPAPKTVLVERSSWG